MIGIQLNDSFEVTIAPVRLANGLIASGVCIDNIDYQRCKLICVAQKGEFKQWPTLGFGIDNYLRSVASVNRQQFIAELLKELKSDGMTSAKVVSEDDLLTFDIEL
jgi:hypothetical protein